MKSFLIMALLVVSGQLRAETAKLKDVETVRDGASFRVDLRFDKPISKEEFTVDFINETVQINVPGAEIAEKKKVTWVKDEKVKHLYTYQTDQGMRQRIILKPGQTALDYEGKVNLSTRGSTLSIDLGGEPVAKDEGLSAILQALPAKAEVKTESEASAKTVALTVKSAEKALTEDEQELFQAVSQVEDLDSVRKEKLSLKESEIPVFKKAEKEASAGGSTYLRMLMSLLIVGGLGVGIFFGVKKYSHKQLSKNKHTSIRVMTQHYLSPKKSLAIVTVAGESILIGITDHTITPIKTLSLLEEEISEVAAGTFSESLKTADSNGGEKKMAAMSKPVESDASGEDDFSIQGIKDIVTERLNGMRNI